MKPSDIQTLGMHAAVAKSNRAADGNKKSVRVQRWHLPMSPQARRFDVGGTTTTPSSFKADKCLRCGVGWRAVQNYFTERVVLGTHGLDIDMDTNNSNKALKLHEPIGQTNREYACVWSFFELPWVLNGVSRYRRERKEKKQKYSKCSNAAKPRVH